MATLVVRRAVQVAREKAATGVAVDSVQVVQEVEAEFQSLDAVIAFARTVPWAELTGVARLVEWTGTQPDTSTGKWSEPYDEPKTVENWPAVSLSCAPLDLFISVMWQQDERLVANVMTNAAGETTGALILCQGAPDQVDAYIAVCAKLDAQMTENPEGRAPRRPYRH
jgi:hypothetical protein